MEEFIRFRTGFFRFPDSNEEGKILFDEEGNIYDKTAEGEYRNCTIYIDNVKYSNATLTILVKKKHFLRHVMKCLCLLFVKMDKNLHS